MKEMPSEWAARLRSAESETARIEARHGLMVAIGKLARQVIARSDVPDDLAEGEANFLAFDIGRRIAAGCVDPGCEDAYVRQCARHRATDYHRKESGVHRLSDFGDRPSEPADSRTPERLMAERQEAALTAARARRLRAIIATAQPAHREVLDEVYIRGTPIEDLARRELSARVARGEERSGDPTAFGRARATVDQRLSRAKAWLRANIAPARRAR